MNTDINLLFSGNEKCTVCDNSSFDYSGLNLKCLNCGKEYPNFKYIDEIDYENLLFGYGSLILPLL